MVVFLHRMIATSDDCWAALAWALEVLIKKLAFPGNFRQFSHL